MYFILSKVLLFVLSPLLWIFTVVIIAIISKNARRKRLLLITAVVMLLLLSNSFLFNEYGRLWGYNSYPTGDTKKYSCAIVLGGFTSVDRNGNGYFNGSADRFLQGIKLLAMGKVNRLLITGGNGNLIAGSYREGEWAKKQLQELKVPDSSVLIESNSRNTIENAVFSKKILLANHLKPPYLLVTSDFHMRRSMMIFKKEGLDVVAYPCNYMAGKGEIGIGSFFIPDAEPLAGWGMYLKELVGYVVDYWKK